MLHKKIYFMIMILLVIPVMSGCFSSSSGVEVPVTTSEEALEIALEQQGKPYVWGGRGPEEFDCSGLITWSYKKAVGEEKIFSKSGYKMDDATMSDLYHWNVTHISLEDMEPGDILFFTMEEGEITHGGLFRKWINDTEFEFVHASTVHEEVRVDTWSTEGNNDSSKWLVGAGRFKK